MEEIMPSEKSAKCVVLFQALGDNLISLYLLNQYHGREKIVILGTALTRKVAELIGVADRFDIEVVFDDIPAFYDVRKKGLLRALKDLLLFRRFLKKRRFGTVILEKKDFRSALMTFGLSRVHYGQKIRQTYLDRKELFEESFAIPIQLKASVKPGRNIRSVLIAPSSRLSVKNIHSNDLENILSCLETANMAVSLVDYTEEYSVFRKKVGAYITGTTLEDVKRLLLGHDLLIGADSFLIHMAYYFEKPFVAVYNVPNLDFLPPGAEPNGSFIVVDPAGGNRAVISDKLKTLGITV